MWWRRMMSKVLKQNAESVFHAMPRKREDRNLEGEQDGASCKPVLGTNMGQPRKQDVHDAHPRKRPGFR